MEKTIYGHFSDWPTYRPSQFGVMSLTGRDITLQLYPGYYKPWSTLPVYSLSLSYGTVDSNTSFVVSSKKIDWEALSPRLLKFSQILCNFDCLSHYLYLAGLPRLFE